VKKNIILLISKGKSFLRRLDPKKIFKIIIYALGSVTLFFYFFSFIGIGIGILFIIFSKKDTWKINGIVLSFAIAVSTWVSNSGLELAPIKLAAATGPTILIGYFTTMFLVIKVRKKRGLPPLSQDIFSKRFKPVIRNTVIVLAIIIPVYIWQAVSMDYGVLLNNSPQILWVHAPTTVEAEKDFKLTVQSWDPYERLSAEYKGTVSFDIESYDINTLKVLESVEAKLPEEYSFTGQNRGSCMAYGIKDGKDNGAKDFFISIDTMGIHYVKVTDLGTGKTYYSNPILVDSHSGSEYNIYWGDVHTHSILSDGSGSMDHNSYYAREVACLDFMGFTDHAEILIWKPGMFDYIEEKINYLNDPGEFVVFQGFEWTQTADGHYSIILSGNKLLKKVNYLNTPKPQDLWDKLDEFTERTDSEALALPHHTTKKEYIQDWTYVDPDYVKIAEVASTHGYFLFEPWNELNYSGSINPPCKPQNGTCIMDAITMGKRLTLYAASDSHDGFPGHTLSHTDANIGHQRPFTIWLTRNEKPYCGGITAVYSEELTRDSIFEGLQDQHIYASGDYGKPYLELSINGISAVENNQLFVDKIDSERELEIVFAQDGAYTPSYLQEPIDGLDWQKDWDASIEVFKNGSLFKKVDVTGPVSSLTITDRSVITGAEYGFERCIEKGGSYYINDYSDQAIDPGLLNTRGTDFYLVRTVTGQGSEAYIGPIWVSVR